MKLVISCALSGWLAIAAVPAAAQAGTPVTDGSIARSVAREASRLTGDAQPASANPDWARVRSLSPGTQIMLTTDGSQTHERLVIESDDAAITLLNLADLTIPASAARVLRNTASDHPEYFRSSGERGVILIDKNVRLTVDGLFVRDQKIASLDQLIEVIRRDDVVRVATRRKGRGVWGHLGPVGGYFAGAMAGGYGLGFACVAAAGPDRCDNGAFLGGAVIGGIAGLITGSMAAARESEQVIYRRIAAGGPASK